MTPTLRFLIYLLLADFYGWAFRTGPPVSQNPTLCTDMIPTGHGASMANTEVPYRITATSATYSAGQAITVTVESLDGTSEIAGVFLQARRKGVGRNGNEAIGTFFNPPSSTQLLACGQQNSAWAHSAKLEATAASVTWIAPPCEEGPLAFMATVVKGPKEFYWTGILSSEMTFTGSNSTECDMAEATTTESAHGPSTSWSTTASPLTTGFLQEESTTAGAVGTDVSLLTLRIYAVSALCIVVLGS